MKFKEVIKEIDTLAILWHESDDFFGDEIDLGVELLIADYILESGYDNYIGNHKFSAIMEIINNGDTDCNDEEFCGYEYDLLHKAMEMYSDGLPFLTLIDDDPIKGKYRKIENVI